MCVYTYIHTYTHTIYIPGHSLDGHFEIIQIEQPPIVSVLEQTDLLRLELEAFWIRILQTKKPFGINVESGKPVERDKIIFPIIYTPTASKQRTQCKDRGMRIIDNDRMAETWNSAFRDHSIASAE